MTSIPLLTFAVLSAAMLLPAFGSWRWRRATEALCAKLDATRACPGPHRYAAQELECLPVPVQRYFRASLREGQPIVAAVKVDHTGHFNMSESGERWRPFCSTQRVTAAPPGFVWNGRIALLPGVQVTVHDAYAAGKGILHASLFGLVTLAKLRETPELAHGELVRFLAEAAWYPTALLPSQGVEWEPVDDTSAKASLSDHNVTVTLLIRFDERGLIASARADARGRTVAGSVVPTPWEARYRNYAVRDGMLVPLEGEVAWLLPEGPKPYWRGRIASLAYDFVKPRDSGR
ncbi:DUF6544 family protein [Paraburkholderia sp. IMGN_8]|uniref:DUF6920 family protein n=1 Tax=Paraburkholderia sp. IMGN_8 TaxID=3136564 RepID=UPI0031019E90